MEIDVPVAVAIVYCAQARVVFEKLLVLEAGSTVAHALQSSGLAAQFPETATPAAGLGIWGKKVGLTHVLRDQDRLEVYRPLTVDPKVARRERFAGQGAKRTAGLFAKRRTGGKAGY